MRSSRPPPGGALRKVAWGAIRYLEDVSGHKVDVVGEDEPTPIPIYYGTRHFTDLLTAVCERLAALHGDKLTGTPTFRGSRSFFAHSGAVLVIVRPSSAPS